MERRLSFATFESRNENASVIHDSVIPEFRRSRGTSGNRGGLSKVDTDCRKSRFVVNDSRESRTSVVCPRRLSKTVFTTVKNHDESHDSRETRARNTPLWRLLIFIHSEQHNQHALPLKYLHFFQTDSRAEVPTNLNVS